MPAAFFRTKDCSTAEGVRLCRMERTDAEVRKAWFFVEPGRNKKWPPPLTSKKKLFFEWRFFYAECKVYGVFGA